MKKALRIFTNKYLLSIAIFLAWITFVNDIDLIFILRSKSEVTQLQQEVEQMKKENQEASSMLSELQTNQVTLEKFARETYMMKRDNEDVFVFREKNPAPDTLPSP
jgi:cell division protein FtsB